MRIFTLFITFLGISACGASDDDDRVSKYLALMEDSLNTSTLLYSRVSPEVAALIKPVAVPAEAREIAECVVNEAKSEDLISEFDDSLKVAKNLADYMRETPSLSITTLSQDEHYMALLDQALEPKFERLQAHGKACGLIDMTMKWTRETGAYEAMKSIR